MLHRRYIWRIDPCERYLWYLEGLLTFWDEGEVYCFCVYGRLVIRLARGSGDFFARKC